ncbi:MAG: hypothetical protein P3T54_00040 [Dehalogenimonas sp.]|nr:hypothetical protein [Dehalogenimonas sp.]
MKTLTAPAINNLTDLDRFIVNYEFKFDELEGLAKTCPHCGHRGLDVVERLKYVGGEGYVPVLGCQNEVECWKRWDEAHS